MEDRHHVAGRVALPLATWYPAEAGGQTHIDCIKSWRLRVTLAVEEHNAAHPLLLTEGEALPMQPEDARAINMQSTCNQRAINMQSWLLHLPVQPEDARAINM
jgi:hypothetical protein